MTKNNKTTAAGATPKTLKSSAEAASTGEKTEETTCEKISTKVVQEMFKVQMVTILACFNQVEVTNTNLLNHDDRAAIKYSREKLMTLQIVLAEII